MASVRLKQLPGEFRYDLVACVLSQNVPVLRGLEWGEEAIVGIAKFPQHVGGAVNGG